MERTQQQVERDNVRRILLNLFGEGGLWRMRAVSVNQIVETLRAIDAWSYAPADVQVVLTSLCRDKQLRSWVCEGHRLYEAVLNLN